MSEISEAYQYINEGIIIDKIKNAIEALKNKKKTAETNNDSDSIEEVNAEAKELKNNIKTSNSLSSNAKKTLLAALVAVIDGLATNADAKMCQINDVIKDGKHIVTQYGDCTQENIDDIQSYKADVKAKYNLNNNKTDDINHLAAVYNKAINNGIKVVSFSIEDKGKSTESKVIKFNDGTGLVFQSAGNIIFFDKNSKISSEYIGYKATADITTAAHELANK